MNYLKLKINLLKSTYIYCILLMSVLLTSPQLIAQNHNQLAESANSEEWKKLAKLPIPIATALYSTFSYSQSLIIVNNYTWYKSYHYEVGTDKKVSESSQFKIKSNSGALYYYFEMDGDHGIVEIEGDESSIISEFKVTHPDRASHIRLTCNRISYE